MTRVCAGILSNGCGSNPRDYTVITQKIKRIKGVDLLGYGTDCLSLMKPHYLQNRSGFLREFLICNK